VCIGPAPQQWLDVADEAGLLLQYEFPIWSDREPMRHKLWKEDDIQQQLRDFMRDNWNHPSVVIWDASNETHWDFLRQKLVPSVRGLDLSGRPWENGYQQPDAPGDPYEVHPYRFGSYVFGKPPYFQMSDLDLAAQKVPDDWRSRHAAIINEYDWLWLHRDGTPTELTRKVYDTILGPDATPDERRALWAYSMAGLTEFWRAGRQHAGVLYLAYLDGDMPHAFTCDNFRDVARLEFDPQFEDYIGQAFKPLGVYVDFWQHGDCPDFLGERRENGTVPLRRTYRVILVNDTHETARGRLTLAWEPEQGGQPAGQVETTFEVAPVGETSRELELPSPPQPGKYLLTARAFWDGKPWSPTLARRKVHVAAAEAKQEKQGLSVDDFRFDGPLGSAGARIEKLAEDHFQVTLGHAPEHPDWANNCQFHIARNAKGKRLLLDVRFDHPKPHYAFDEYFHSWSYDGVDWQPIRWKEKSNGKSNRLEFPAFEQDQVHFGLQVPLSYEDSVRMQEKWAGNRCVKLHELGKSLGGRRLCRVEITDPESPHPRRARWGHYFANQHPGEHNSQWRMVGMIEWLLSDAGADLRRRSICHFILLMSPDGPSQGWYRVNAQGVDMNRSYVVDGADSKKQAHEAYAFQKDLEALMASESPATDVWSMHTWGGTVDPMLLAGPECGGVLEPKERFRDLLDQSDPKDLVRPLRFAGGEGLTHWSGGPHKQFGISAVLCEGAGGILTKQDNLDSGAAIIKAIAQYYRGLRQ
jgi:hypothetical protein